MPYPLPSAPDERMRVLPPMGCPGLEVWVVPHEVPRWLRMGYRLGPVPADQLELYWNPADRLWDEPITSAAIELHIDPLVKAPQPIAVSWGDGSTETIGWDAMARDVPRPRHVYLNREDLTVTVTIGISIASLQVALIGCPVPPYSVPTAGSSTGGLIGVEPLVPGAGLQGNAYNGSVAQQWQLRLHPSGGLGFLPSPVDGEPALAAMNSEAGGRATRWYSGDGPPVTELLQPPPALGDLYLDRISGQVYELVV
jgi:hypothetical protein